MRFALVILGVLAFSNIGRADLDSSITEQKEEGLEADSTAMEIHDVEQEQKLAREQARAQEQMKKASEKRLTQLKTQRANMAEKYKLDIMLSEQRRKKAEQETLVVKKQIATVQANINALQMSKDKAEKAAANARAISQAGREALRNLQQKKNALEVDNQRAQNENLKAQNELKALRAQSRRLQANTKESNQTK